MPGSLVLVATPIGNLEDITLRALRALKEADLVAAEDTRRTRHLLTHYGIGTPTTSLHEHNERARVPALIRQVREGRRIAVVTDAGMPSISDPGFLIVRTAIEEGVPVEIVPGVSALTMAIAGSGLPASEVSFLGFAPSREGARRRWLQEKAGKSVGTMVIFEAPGRLRSLLEDIRATLGNRQVVVAHELTKLHESWHRGLVDDLLSETSGIPLPTRGEFVVLVSDQTCGLRSPDDPIDEGEVAALFGRLQAEPGRTRRQILDQVAEAFHLPRKDVYAIVEKHKSSVK